MWESFQHLDSLRGLRKEGSTNTSSEVQLSILPGKALKLSKDVLLAVSVIVLLSSGLSGCNKTKPVPPVRTPVPAAAPAKETGTPGAGRSSPTQLDYTASMESFMSDGSPLTGTDLSVAEGESLLWVVSVRLDYAKAAPSGKSVMSTSLLESSTAGSAEDGLTDEQKEQQLKAAVNSIELNRECASKCPGNLVFERVYVSEESEDEALSDEAKAKFRSLSGQRAFFLGSWDTSYSDSGSYIVKLIANLSGSAMKNGDLQKSLRISVLETNRAPAVTGVSLQKGTSTSGQETVYCNVSARDPDGDELVVQRQMVLVSADGSVPGNAKELALLPDANVLAPPSSEALGGRRNASSGPLLEGEWRSSSTLRAGSVIVCVATTADPYGLFSEPFASEPLLIENHAPRISMTKVERRIPSPAPGGPFYDDASPKVGDFVRCRVEFSDEDAEQTPRLVDAEFLSTNGSRLLLADATSNPESLMLVTQSAAHNRISCRARVTDGFITVSTLSDGVQVANTAPEVVEASLFGLTSIVASGEKVTCRVVVKDADGDAMSVSLSFLNGSTVRGTGSLVQSQTVTGAAGETITTVLREYTLKGRHEVPLAQDADVRGNGVSCSGFGVDSRDSIGQTAGSNIITLSDARPVLALDPASADTAQTVLAGSAMQPLLVSVRDADGDEVSVAFAAPSTGVDRSCLAQIGAEGLELALSPVGNRVLGSPFSGSFSVESGAVPFVGVYPQPANRNCAFMIEGINTDPGLAALPTGKALETVRADILVPNNFPALSCSNLSQTAIPACVDSSGRFQASTSGCEGGLILPIACSVTDPDSAGLPGGGAFRISMIVNGLESTLDPGLRGPSLELPGTWHGTEGGCRLSMDGGVAQPSFPNGGRPSLQLGLSEATISGRLGVDTCVVTIEATDGASAFPAQAVARINPLSATYLGGGPFERQPVGASPGSVSASASGPSSISDISLRVSSTTSTIGHPGVSLPQLDAACRALSPIDTSVFGNNQLSSFLASGSTDNTSLVTPRLTAGKPFGAIMHLGGSGGRAMTFSTLQATANDTGAIFGGPSNFTTLTLEVGTTPAGGSQTLVSRSEGFFLESLPVPLVGSVSGGFGRVARESLAAASSAAAPAPIPFSGSQASPVTGMLPEYLAARRPSLRTATAASEGTQIPLGRLLTNGLSGGGPDDEGGDGGDRLSDVTGGGACVDQSSCSGVSGSGISGRQMLFRVGRNNLCFVGDPTSQSVTTTSAGSGGGLYCMGRAHRGQAGPIETDLPTIKPQSYNQDSPAKFPAYTFSSSNGETRVAGIAIGGDHVCVLTDPDNDTLSDAPSSSRFSRGGGYVHCYGLNDRGQLGRNFFDNSANVSYQPPSGPSALPSIRVRSDTSAHLTEVVQIAAGLNHTCALRADGTVWCWGDNFYGQLGRGTSGQEGPNDCKRSGEVSARSCSVGAMSALLSPSGAPKRFTAVYAHGDTTCALDAEGGYRCWGRNAYGERGDSQTNANVSAVTVAGSFLGGGLDVSSGGTGGGSLANNLSPNQSSLASALDGNGSSLAAALSSGSSAFRSALGRLVFRHGIVALSGGTPPGSAGVDSGFLCALDERGSVACAGQIASVFAAPVLGRVDAESAVRLPLSSSSIVNTGTSQNSAMALLFATGSHPAIGAGGNVSGFGKTLNQSTTPVESDLTASDAFSKGIRGAVSMSSGYDFTCATLASGTVRCFGSNERGALGGGVNASTTPALPYVPQVGGPTLLPDDVRKVSGAGVDEGALRGVIAMAAAGYGACAGLADGSLRCWGENTSSRFGGLSGYGEGAASFGAREILPPGTLSRQVCSNVFVPRRLHYGP